MVSALVYPPPSRSLSLYDNGSSLRSRITHPPVQRRSSTSVVLSRHLRDITIPPPVDLAHTILQHASIILRMARKGARRARAQTMDPPSDSARSRGWPKVVGMARVRAGRSSSASTLIIPPATTRVFLCFYPCIRPHLMSDLF